MFKFQEIWLPDGEKHFPEWMAKNGEIIDGKGTYQIKKWRACLPWVKNWRTAVDIGAHVGLWSMQMTKRFQMLHVFEPMPEFRECWVKNMEPFMNGPEDANWNGHSMQLHQCALGAAPGHARMEVPKIGDGIDSGGTHIGQIVNDTALSRDMEPIEGFVPIHPLDDFDLHDVDFVKIDCEGYEHHVIEGARETLLRCKPCVIVEQKPHKLGPNFGIKGTPAVDLLRDMGAIVRKEMSGDYIMSWD